MADDITILIREASAGNTQAADQLFRLVEADLRAIADSRRQNFTDALDAPITLLVNEAFCRLFGITTATAASLADRRAFFGFAAVKIHDLLVDLERQHQAQKRGGAWQRQVELDLPTRPRPSTRCNC